MKTQRVPQLGQLAVQVHLGGLNDFLHLLRLTPIPDLVFLNSPLE
ncbi:hypothetical protein [Deinococcus radiotolerans]|nr:hypothetical protein [Deinococcus radiotolerans]